MRILLRPHNPRFPVKQHVIRRALHAIRIGCMLLELHGGDRARFRRYRRGTKEMANHPLVAQAQRNSDAIDPEIIRIRLLGGFGISVGSRTVDGNGWRLRKAKSLVKLLALAQGHRLHRERITSALWPDLDEKSAANNLHRALHFARAALEPGAENTTSRYLSLQGDLLALCPEGPLWVDVEAFEEAARTARHVYEPAAYRAAVDLTPAICSLRTSTRTGLQTGGRS